jgi:myo-inositol-1(or 4)-monophosphatase
MTGWETQLDVARKGARLAGQALRSQFGKRAIAAYKGPNDVLLAADLTAQDVIAGQLRGAYPGYGLISEEEIRGPWPERDSVWVVDPLDGSNNFGYGIAHCAVAITLFHWDSVVLALVFDPLLEREFFATEHRAPTPLAGEGVRLCEATVSLVTNYSPLGRDWLTQVNEALGSRCKRLVNLWAPALDLALVATGELDAMVCHDGDALDVCGGLFLVRSAGGCVLDLHGQPLGIGRSAFDEPISFVAARTEELAGETLDAVLREVPVGPVRRRTNQPTRPMGMINQKESSR